jgi:hypothetical protein
MAEDAQDESSAVIPVDHQETLDRPVMGAERPEHPQVRVENLHASVSNIVSAVSARASSTARSSSASSSVE